jgi:hypothetical protein
LLEFVSPSPLKIYDVVPLAVTLYVLLLHLYVWTNISLSNYGDKPAHHLNAH